MTHRQLYSLFRDIFSNCTNADTLYFPNGRNSIRIRGVVGLHNDRIDYVFTYYSNSRWRLETVDCYLDRMKGEKHV